MDLVDCLNWRYATKRMDPTRTVPDAKLARILEAIRLTATSSGLQPFEVIVIRDPELKRRIREVGYDQPQITECSHLLVFAAWDHYTPERINLMFDLVNSERGVRNEGWENYRQQVLATYPPRDPEMNFAHAARQAYIALGTALIAAACEQVDSTPMEGFLPDQVDDILSLRDRGLRSVCILPLGYRDAANDWLVNLKKVRRASEDLIRYEDP